MIHCAAFFVVCRCHVLRHSGSLVLNLVILFLSLHSFWPCAYLIVKYGECLLYVLAVFRQLAELAHLYVNAKSDFKIGDWPFYNLSLSKEVLLKKFQWICKKPYFLSFV